MSIVLKIQHFIEITMKMSRFLPFPPRTQDSDSFHLRLVASAFASVFK